MQFLHSFAVHRLKTSLSACSDPWVLPIIFPPFCDPLSKMFMDSHATVSLLQNTYESLLTKYGLPNGEDVSLAVASCEVAAFGEGCCVGDALCFNLQNILNNNNSMTNECAYECLTNTKHVCEWIVTARSYMCVAETFKSTTNSHLMQWSHDIANICLNWRNQLIWSIRFFKSAKNLSFSYWA